MKRKRRAAAAGANDLTPAARDLDRVRERRRQMADPQLRLRPPPNARFHSFIPTLSRMAQKVVLKIMTMTDDKTKQKAIEAAADIYGVDSIAAELKDQKLTVIGTMDTVAMVKKLKKVGKVDILSVGPAKEEKKGDDKKGEDKKGNDMKGGQDKKADDKKAGGGDKK